MALMPLRTIDASTSKDGTMLVRDHSLVIFNYYLIYFCLFDAFPRKKKPLMVYLLFLLKLVSP